MESFRPFLAFANTSSNVAAPRNNQGYEASGSEDGNSSLVLDPVNDQASEERELSIVSTEVETNLLGTVTGGNNIVEHETQREATEENEKIMPPLAKKKRTKISAEPSSSVQEVIEYLQNKRAIKKTLPTK